MRYVIKSLYQKDVYKDIPQIIKTFRRFCIGYGVDLLRNVFWLDYKCWAFKIIKAFKLRPGEFLGKQLYCCRVISMLGLRFLIYPDMSPFL